MGHAVGGSDPAEATPAGLVGDHLGPALPNCHGHDLDHANAALLGWRDAALRLAPMWPAVVATGVSLSASLTSWVAAVRFYDPFGVSPTEVGIGPPSLLAPAAVLAVAFVAGLLFGDVAGRSGHHWSDRMRGSRRGSDFVAVMATLSILLPALLALQVNRSVASMTVRLVVTVVVAASILAQLAGAGMHTSQARAWRRVTALLFVFPVIAWFAAEAGATFFLTSNANSASPFVLRFGQPARFVRVAAHVPELKALETAACVVDLGSGPAGRVLVVENSQGDVAHVEFVNSQLVSTRSAGRCAMVLPTGKRVRAG